LPAGGFKINVLVVPSSAMPLVTLLQFTELTLLVFCWSTLATGFRVITRRLDWVVHLV
jgi:hypothetical protein